MSKSPTRRVFRKMTAAMAEYRPKPYHGGPIVYLHAAVPLPPHFDPMPVWRRVACGGLKIIEMPGVHLELVGPQVQLTAAAIDRALASAV